MVEFRIRVVVDTSGAERGSKRVERGLKRTTDQADRLRATLARAFAILGGFAIIRNTIRTLADFGQEMATIRAITNATAEQFERLTEEAKRLGATTRFAATEAAEGMTLLARAGFTVDEVLTSINGVLVLAQSGAIGLAQAADIAAGALRGFRLDVDQTGRVMDVLSLAAASANTNVGGVGDALSFVAPVAASLGLSIEKTTAAIQILSDASLKGSRAGTGLNRVLANLKAPTGELKKLLDAAGVSADEVDPSLVGLTGAIEAVGRAGFKAGDGLKFFGLRGGPAFEVMAAAIPDILEAEAALLKADGTAARIAKTMDKTLKGALFAVKSAFEAVKLALGAAGLDPALERAARSLAGGLRFLAKNIEIVINLAEALGVVIGIKLVRAFARLAIAIAANPLGFFITAITAATALLVGFADQIGIGSDSLATLQDVGVAAFNAISDIARPILESIGQLFGEIFGRAGTAGFTFREFVELAAFAFDRLLGIARGTVFATRTLFSGLFTQALPDLAIQGINLVLAGFELLLDGIIALFKAIGQLIATFATNFVLGFANLGRAASQALGSNFENAEQFAADAVTNFEAAFAQFDPDVIARTVANQFKKAQQDTIIPQLNNTFKDGAKNLGANVKEAFLVGFEQDTILGFVRSIFAEADQLAADRAVREAEGAAGGGIQKAAEDLDKLKASAAAVPAEIDKVVESITLLGKVLDGVVAVAFENVGDALLDFAETGKFVFKDFVNQLLDDIKRLIVRLLVLQAIQAVTGVPAGGLPTPGRQAGGPVAPNRPFLVGEQGPEVFRPQGSGSIVPAGETAAMMARAGQASAAPVVVEVAAPAVNVNITNQNDPNEFKEEVDSGRLDISIVNVLQRKKSTSRQSLGV